MQAGVDWFGECIGDGAPLDEHVEALDQVIRACDWFLTPRMWADRQLDLFTTVLPERQLPP